MLQVQVSAAFKTGNRETAKLALFRGNKVCPPPRSILFNYYKKKREIHFIWVMCWSISWPVPLAWQAETPGTYRSWHTYTLPLHRLKQTRYDMLISEPLAVSTVLSPLLVAAERGRTKMKTQQQADAVRQLLMKKTRFTGRWVDNQAGEQTGERARRDSRIFHMGNTREHNQKQSR